VPPNRDRSKPTVLQAQAGSHQLPYDPLGDSASTDWTLPTDNEPESEEDTGSRRNYMQKLVGSHESFPNVARSDGGAAETAVRNSHPRADVSDAPRSPHGGTGPDRRTQRRLVDPEPGDLAPPGAGQDGGDTSSDDKPTHTGDRSQHDSIHKNATSDNPASSSDHGSSPWSRRPQSGSAQAAPTASALSSKDVEPTRPTPDRPRQPSSDARQPDLVWGAPARQAPVRPSWTYRASKPVPVPSASTRQDQRGVGGRTYLVEAGDTLFDIARNELGDGARWREILRLNRETLGDDSHDLSPGTKLILPSRPAQAPVVFRPRFERRH
jgi:hypothetical protein